MDLNIDLEEFSSLNMEDFGRMTLTKRGEGENRKRSRPAQLSSSTDGDDAGDSGGDEESQATTAAAGRNQDTPMSAVRIADETVKRSRRQAPAPRKGSMAHAIMEGASSLAGAFEKITPKEAAEGDRFGGMRSWCISQLGSAEPTEKRIYRAAIKTFASHGKDQVLCFSVEDIINQLKAGSLESAEAASILEDIGVLSPPAPTQ